MHVMLVQVTVHVGANNMTIEEFEKKYNVRLIPKNKSKLMKAVGIFSKKFMTDYWTTYRVFGSKPTISYSVGETNPMGRMDMLEHELIHVEDMRSTWGLIKTAALYFAVPLPILFSGRWFVERKAYLHDIKAGHDSVDSAIESLWRGYIYPWPRRLMRKWFNKQLKK